MLAAMTVSPLAGLFYGRPAYQMRTLYFLPVVSYSSSLWPPYGIGQAIKFLPCGFFLLLFFRV